MLHTSHHWQTYSWFPILSHPLTFHGKTLYCTCQNGRAWAGKCCTQNTTRIVPSLYVVNGTLYLCRCKRSLQVQVRGGECHLLEWHDCHWLENMIWHVNMFCARFCVMCKCLFAPEIYSGITPLNSFLFSCFSNFFRSSFKSKRNIFCCHENCDRAHAMRLCRRC